MLSVCCSISARETDSLVLNRMFTYHKNYHHKIDTFTTNCYTKFFYDTQRRNFTLWLIPNMYSFAKKERQYVSEQFSQVSFYDINDIRVKPDLFFTTVPHERKPFSVLNEFSVPQLYSTTLYGNHILSPFNPDNRIYYRYRVRQSGIRQATVEFRPLLGNNTQLVKGEATVLLSTGRILDVDIQGEYDMIKFHTTIHQGFEKWKNKTVLPSTCKTDVDFRFMGNRINSSFVSVYELPNLPDTIDSTKTTRNILDKIRPMQLSPREKAVLERYDSTMTHKDDTLEKDTTTRSMTLHTLRDIGWDIGTYLVKSHETGNQHFSLHLSPILQPQYLNYSHSRGLSYKMKLAVNYHFTPNSSIQFNPTLGYNFKIRQFFYQLPLRYTYSEKWNNYLEISWNNGNRIGNSSVVEDLKEKKGDMLELEEYDLTTFDDNMVKITNSMRVTNWLRVEEGLVYHRRTALHKEHMKAFGMPEVYKSMAPSITMIFQPWKKGPLFSVNYEQGLKFKNYELSYGRWEATASRIFRLPRTQLLNLRLGGGFYTDKRNNYFMDYANFSEDYLQGGWDDDWSGSFQLLDSRLYNVSSYYINSNVSFDSPLMMTSFLPIVGRYIERERFYWNGVLLEDTHPYWEIGYGFTTRLCSIGIFGNMSQWKFNKFGVKFTIELFHRW